MKSSEAPTETVRACVRDILASQVFSRSGRLRAFLEYVVECELAGKAGQLKGYTIGIDVFGRPAGFDAGTDPIVRVQAGKLRKLLDQYYEKEGENASLRIRIPIGSYVPEYEVRTSNNFEPEKPDVENAAPFRARRKRNVFRRCWRPAPVSSHFAILTLLPLFVLAPTTHRDAGLSLITEAKLSVGKHQAEIDHGGSLPSLRIESGPFGSGDCRAFAEAIAKAAGYHKTVRPQTQSEPAQAGPLDYTIRVEPARKRDAIYVRLVHDRSGETIHAERFRTTDLDDRLAVTYEAVAYAGRLLSASGQIYVHATQSGTVSDLMACLQEADRQRLSGGVPAPCQPSPRQVSAGPVTTRDHSSLEPKFKILNKPIPD